MPFKMKRSAYKMKNVATKSALKHSGSKYKAEVKAKDGVDIPPSSVKGHDEGHRTKWNPDHSDKIKK